IKSAFRACLIVVNSETDKLQTCFSLHTIPGLISSVPDQGTVISILIGFGQNVADYMFRIPVPLLRQHLGAGASTELCDTRIHWPVLLFDLALNIVPKLKVKFRPADTNPGYPNLYLQIQPVVTILIPDPSGLLPELKRTHRQQIINNVAHVMVLPKIQRILIPRFVLVFIHQLFSRLHDILQPVDFVLTTLDSTLV